MRPLELLAEAKPIITKDGMAAIQLSKRALKALIEDVESCSVRSGFYDEPDLLGLPKGQVWYNGTLYVAGP